MIQLVGKFVLRGRKEKEKNIGEKMFQAWNRTEKVSFNHLYSLDKQNAIIYLYLTKNDRAVPV